MGRGELRALPHSLRVWGPLPPSLPAWGTKRVYPQRMRWIKRIAAGLVILFLLFTAFFFCTVRRSFPQVDGELGVGGLNDRVEVIRDEWGVPHIFATNTDDLFFAQGYTHAQERFWQMDFWRHIGAGRLSELFGEDQVDTDKFLRSLDFTGLARQEMAMMGPEERGILQAYADGVNAYLEDQSKASISLEYAILGLQNGDYQIEPWEPIHTLTWAKLMSWDLSGNLAQEIDRTVLARILPVDRVEQLYPGFPDTHPYILPTAALSGDERRSPQLPDEAVDSLVRVGDSARQLWALTGGGFEGIGSNNWVLNGAKTRSGMPLLANDTHLAIQMPAIWFANGLFCEPVGPACPYRVTGFSFAGVPSVIIGHNERIAWGVTTQSVDTQDLFIERLNPDNPDQYEANGEWVDFEKRTETIRVAGGEDVTYEVLVSRNGPIVSGTLFDEDEFDGSAAIQRPARYAVALAWETLRPSTLVSAVLGLNTAANYNDFRAAAQKWDIAAQNLIYADVEGNIAYQSTGRVPVRANGDGRYPVPGWTGEYDWVGVVPFGNMPFMLNPPGDFIQTANQYVIPSSQQPFLTTDGGHGYRAARIHSVLAQSDEHSVATMQALQFDSRDGGAALVIPHLLAVDPDGDQGVMAIQEELQAWAEGDDPLQARGDSGAAAAYQATWRHLLANTFHDELPEDLRPYGGGRWFTVMRDLLGTHADPYWDDVSTAAVEVRDDILLRSMEDAHAELSSLFKSRDHWAWGVMHTAEFRNQTFGRSGIGPIEWLFNRSAPLRVSGSDALVNSNGWNASVGYEIDWISSQRLVVDLADFDRSTFLHSTGQSGHAFHAHYRDMIEPWTDGVQAPMLWSRDAIVEAGVSTLVLRPE